MIELVSSIVGKIGLADLWDITVKIGGYPLIMQMEKLEWLKL
uniref:Uncharacterized protein n=1 Tax=Rhizophora mucronata TaxID=61149 RepID=A0A2P2NEP7_RHIMU